MVTILIRKVSWKSFAIQYITRYIGILKDVVHSLSSKGHYYSIYTDKNIKDQQNRLQHRSREAHLQYQFDQIEQLRQKNREKFRERIQRKNNG